MTRRSPILTRVNRRDEISRLNDKPAGSNTMTPRDRVAALESRAVEVLGRAHATRWMHLSNRKLAQLSPYELAETSDVGYRVALGALETHVARLAPA
jgi:hypothetical protein